MPVEYLSVEQEARYGRFVADPSPLELERFFRLNGEALSLLRGKRREENRLGFAVQWGTVRMLGTFLGEDPTAVPAGVAAFVAEQLGRTGSFPGVRGASEDGVRASVGDPRQCGYREFAAGEAELREFLAARVWRAGGAAGVV